MAHKGVRIPAAPSEDVLGEMFFLGLRMSELTGLRCDRSSTAPTQSPSPAADAPSPPAPLPCARARAPRRRPDPAGPHHPLPWPRHLPQPYPKRVCLVDHLSLLDRF